MPPTFVELKARRLNGQVIDVEVAGIPIENGDQPLEQLLVRDITTRKLARDALLLYKEIVANAGDAIAVFGPYGSYIDQNEAHQRLIGYTDEELADSTPAIHLGADIFASIQRELRRTGTYYGEYLSKHRNGIMIEVELAAFAIPETKATPTRFVMILRDIGQRKRTQSLLMDQERALAVLQERNRLAGEIHDTLAQSFAGINLQLGAALIASQDASQEVKKALTRSIELAKDGLRHSKMMVWDLVPIELEGQPLEVALSKEVDRFSALGGWNATFKLSGRRRKLDHRTQVAVLRICQEALANVNQHAHARTVAVHLAFNPRSLALTVQDDGVGFHINRTAKRRAGKSYGLVNMESRARSLGGSIAVKSAQGKGTSVRFELPWPAEAAAEPEKK